MVTQQIFLPMIPDSAPIVVNIAQYDFDAAGYAGRLFFNLVSDGVAYDMDGASAIFQGEKPDGTMFAYPASVVNASVVRVNVRQQMTAVAGRVVCNLVVSNTDGQIGSFNIWLEVQPSSGSGSDPSETDIPALIAQAKQYADAAEQAASEVAAYSENPPYIGANGNWFVYDAVNDQFIDTGVYAAGIEGNLWYNGTAISGKSSTPSVYPTGIATARQGDMYLNKVEGAIYTCTLGGADTVAKWVYVMTLAGGGGGVSDYNDLGGKPQIEGNNLVGGNQTAASLGLQAAMTAGSGIDISALNVISAKLLAGSNVTLTPKPDGSIEISSSGGGGGGDTVSWTQIQGSSGATKIAEIDINGTPTDVYAPSGGGSAYTMLPDPTVDPSTLTPPKTNEENVVDAVTLGVTEGYGNDDIASLNTIGTWANNFTKKYLVQATSAHPFSTTGIGTWPSDIDNPTSGEKATWLEIPELYNIGTADKIDVKLSFDPAKSGVITLGGWVISDNESISDGNGGTMNGGLMCIKFGNEISSADIETAAVGIEIIVTRTAPSIISAR